MELSRELREGVLSGDITVTFRLWRTPKAKAGGRYRVGLGQIEVDSIELVRSCGELAVGMAQAPRLRRSGA